jgi:hypothetical protein
MSKECSSSLNETKPQRSFFQRLIHSTLFRSCWSTTQPALEESALASTSLLREQSTKYDSYKNVSIKISIKLLLLNRSRLKMSS